MCSCRSRGDGCAMTDTALPAARRAPGRARRSLLDHSLVQLTLVRYHEFLREPEAVFWVFVFPILLAAGLGIAFRNQAPERLPVAVVGAGEASTRLVQALGRSSAL